MPVSMTIIDGLSFIMVTINSSVNFIIYYFLGESFRKELKKMAKESTEQLKRWSSTLVVTGSSQIIWSMQNLERAY